MKNASLKNATCLVTGFFVMVPAILPGAEPEKVRLHLDGAYCMGCAAELRDALLAGGAKRPSKIAPNRGRGHVIVLVEFRHDADLSPLAKSVSGAATPHREQARPGVALELFAKLDEASAKSAMEALGRLKGVDAKGSTVDAKQGVLSVRLTGESKLTVNDLLAALKEAGINASVVTDTAPKDKA